MPVELVTRKTHVKLPPPVTMQFNPDLNCYGRSKAASFPDTVKQEFIKVAKNYLRVVGDRESCFFTLKIAGVFVVAAAIYGALCYYSFLDFYPLPFALSIFIGVSSLMYSTTGMKSLCEYSSVNSQLHKHLAGEADVESAATKYLTDALNDQDKISEIKLYIESLDHSSLWTAHNRNLETNKLRFMLGMEPHF